MMPASHSLPLLILLILALVSPCLCQLDVHTNKRQYVNSTKYPITAGRLELPLPTSKLRVDISAGTLPEGAEGIVFSSDPRNLQTGLPSYDPQISLKSHSFVMSAYNSSGTFGGKLNKVIVIHLDMTSVLTQSISRSTTSVLLYNDPWPSRDSGFMNCTSGAPNEWVDDYTIRISICHFSRFYPMLSMNPAPTPLPQTTTTKQNQSGTNPNIGVIIGASVGGFAFLCGIVIGIVAYNFYKRDLHRRIALEMQRQQSPSSQIPTVQTDYMMTEPHHTNQFAPQPKQCNDQFPDGNPPSGWSPSPSAPPAEDGSVIPHHSPEYSKDFSTMS